VFGASDPVSGSPVSENPHEVQNLRPSGTIEPQRGHASCTAPVSSGDIAGGGGDGGGDGPRIGGVLIGGSGCEAITGAASTSATGAGICSKGWKLCA